MNDLQRNIIAAAAGINQIDVQATQKSLKTEKEGAEFVQKMMEAFLARK